MQPMMEMMLIWETGMKVTQYGLVLTGLRIQENM